MNSIGSDTVITAADSVFSSHPSSTKKPANPRTYGTNEMASSASALAVDFARASSPNTARTSLTPGTVAGEWADRASAVDAVIDMGVVSLERNECPTASNPDGRG